MWQKAFKFLKWICISLAGLMLLITLLLLIFRKDIQRYALSQLDQYLDTKVYVYDMDVTFWSTFPNLSIEFDKVLIKDEMIVEGTLPDTLLYAETIILKLNTGDFWRGDYTVKSIDIKNARLGLRVAADGRVNYHIIKTDSATGSESFQFVLDKVHIVNLDFTYDNFTTGQHYRAQASELNFHGAFSESRFDMRTTGDLFVNRIRSKSVSLVTNKKAHFDVVIAIDKTNRAFILEKSAVSIENLPFIVSGRIANDSIDFELSGNSIPLRDFAANFNQSAIAKIRNYNGTGNVDFSLSIRGATNVDRPPLVEAQFKISNGSLTDPDSKIQLKQVHVKGTFTNNYGENEELNLEKLHFASLNSRFEGFLKITQFDKPEVKGAMKGELDLGTIHHFFHVPGVAKIKGILGGNATVHLKLNDPKRDPKNITIYNLRGDFDLKNVAIAFHADLPEISNMSGKLSMIKDNAVFQSMVIQTGRSKIELSGSVKNMLGYFADKSDLLVDAVVDVEKLYSADFYSNKGSAPTSTSAFGAYLLPKNLKGSVVLAIKRFYLDEHLFEDISARFTIKNRSYSTPSIKFKHIESQTSGSLLIEENRPSEIEVAGNLNTFNINFNMLFKEWKDFDQKVITGQQIYGQASVNLQFYLPFNLQKGLQKEKLEAHAKFTIKNGALKDVEMFRSITTSMRENAIVRTVLGSNIDALESKLQNLNFQTLENTLKISSGRMTIPKMQIRSSALDIDFRGWHAFNNDLDYHFDFRLRDLKFNKKESEFGEIIDDGTGKRIFLHLYGNTDALNFKWDADANKAYKEQQREEEKQNIKSMLKTELGLFKKDTTVTKYVEKEKPKERLEIIFENQKEEVKEDLPKEKNKMKKLFGMDLEKMRQENSKEKELEFTID